MNVNQRSAVRFGAKKCDSKNNATTVRQKSKATKRKRGPSVLRKAKDASEPGPRKFFFFPTSNPHRVSVEMHCSNCDHLQRKKDCTKTVRSQRLKTAEATKMETERRNYRMKLRPISGVMARDAEKSSPTFRQRCKGDKLKIENKTSSITKHGSKSDEEEGKCLSTSCLRSLFVILNDNSLGHLNTEEIEAEKIASVESHKLKTGGNVKTHTEKGLPLASPGDTKFTSLENPSTIQQDSERNAFVRSHGLKTR